MPIVHAGDVFDRWDCPTEFVNLIIAHAPAMYVVAGQHDLPNHRYEDIRRSALWTLCETSNVINLGRDEWTHVGKDLIVTAFPWGTEPRPATPVQKGWLNVAVVHRYVWWADRVHPGADVSFHVSGLSAQASGYDVILAGDNHQGFSVEGVFNHGTALRRHADERHLKVGPGVLYSDGTVERRELLLLPEQWAECADAAKSVEPAGIDPAELLALLRAGGDAVVSFRDAVAAIAQANSGVIPSVRRVLKGWLG